MVHVNMCVFVDERAGWEHLHKAKIKKDPQIRQFEARVLPSLCSRMRAHVHTPSVVRCGRCTSFDYLNHALPISFRLCHCRNCAGIMFSRVNETQCEGVVPSHNLDTEPAGISSL